MGAWRKEDRKCKNGGGERVFTLNFLNIVTKRRFWLKKNLLTVFRHDKQSKSIGFYPSFYFLFSCFNRVIRFVSVVIVSNFSSWWSWNPHLATYLSLLQACLRRVNPSVSRLWPNNKMKTLVNQWVATAGRLQIQRTSSTCLPLSCLCLFILPTDGIRLSSQVEWMSRRDSESGRVDAELSRCKCVTHLKNWALVKDVL